MSQPWWVKGVSASSPPKWGLGGGLSSVREPVLLPSDRASVIADVKSRIPAYTPEWAAQGSDDAGVALMTLFGGLMEPVLTRLDELPQKAFVEALRIIGIDALPAEPASAMLEFKILDSATESVLIPQGFQVGARPPAGSGNMVILETQDNLYATAAQITQLQVQEGSFFLDITPDPNAPRRFRPSAQRQGRLGPLSWTERADSSDPDFGRDQRRNPGRHAGAGREGGAHALADRALGHADLGGVRRRLGLVPDRRDRLRRHE